MTPLDELELDEELYSRPEHLDQQVQADSITLKPKQARFILSKAPYCAYGGGVGNGKTLSAIIKVYQHCQEQPGAYFLIGRKYFPELRDSTMRDFLQLMGKYGTYSAQDKKFVFPNGSEVIFRHLDNQDSLTNLNLSGFYVDQAEDIPEETFDYLSGRCRLQRSKIGTPITERTRIITFNPKGHNWIWRLFNEHQDADGRPLPQPEDYHMATTLENKDNLPEDYLKSLESKPKVWRDRFVYGSFDTKAGRIFEEWNRSVHVVPRGHFQIPELWEKFRAIDHGQNNPTSCHWYAVDFDGNIFCVGSKTRVLTADLKWVEAGSVAEGDVLAGFDENVPETGKRRWQPSVVESVDRVIKPSYKITLSDGTQVVCSEDHQWLVETLGKRKQWMTTEQIKEGYKLLRVTDTWEDDTSNGGGYLAGAFDGEGCLIQNNHGTLAMSISQKDNYLLNRVKSELDARSIRYGVYDSGISGGEVFSLAITRKRDILRLLGSVRPGRLLPKFKMENLGGFSAFAYPTIVSKEKLGETEVVAIQTSSRTYIAEGLASHNCYKEYYKPNTTVSVHVRRINEMSREWTPQGIRAGEYAYTVIDPSTHAKTREKDGWKFSVADEYADAGINTIGAQNDVLAGINRVREYMRIDPDRFHPFLKVSDLDPGHPLMRYNIGRNPDDPVKGSPKLFIFENCEMMLKEIPEYEWQPLKYNQIGLTNENEKPIKNFDHAVDDLRYAIMSRPIGPQEVAEIPEGIWASPIALQRYANKHRTSVDTLNQLRYRLNRGEIRHNEGRISVQDRLHGE
jgi:hypothetical protein